MKKTLSIIIAFVASLQIAFSQNVTINDPNFLAALISAGVDTDNDGIIQTSEAQAKQALDVNDKNISDLTGIEEFTNLYALFCSGNKLTTIDCSKNINLKTLNCSSNLLTSMNLIQNVKLEYVECSKNKLSNVDFSKNINLTSLTCNTNQLKSLDLSQNTKLWSLECAYNQLTNLDLTNNPLMYILTCNSNKIQSLNVNTCSDLVNIDCSDNQLNTVSVTNNTQLQLFKCYSNPLTSLDLTQNTKLWGLSCGWSSLTALDVSKCSKLIEFQFQLTLIDNIDLSNNPSLSTVYCFNTKLTKLDLRNNHKVSAVSAESNPQLKIICLSDESVTFKTSYPNNFSKDFKTIWSTTCVSSSPQTITFPTPNTIKYGTQNYTLAATSSSGLPITYTSSNTSIATISNNVVTTLGVGTVTITASQAGNADFDKATDVAQLLEIVKDTSVISFDKLPNIMFGTPTLELNASSNNTQTDIVYESLNPEIATVSGNVVTILKVGTAQIKASQVGNANYVAAKSITQPLVVYAFQIITFDTIPTKTINDKSFVIQASTSSDLPLTYESTNKTVATVNGNIVTIVGIGETDIVVSQDGNDNYFGASVSQKLKVTQATAINEVNIENIEIYPNPSNGIIHVSNNQYFTDLKISNLNAETVFTSTLNESSFQTLDINTLPAGIYVIELSNGVAQQKSKLVICD